MANRSGKKSAAVVLLLGLAIVLLLGSAVGSTQAALTYFSEYYTAEVGQYDIGVTLVETSAKGTKDISNRDYTGSDDKWNEKEGVLLKDMLKETDGQLKLGRDYKEELKAKNSGNIDEYVRMRVFRSWLTKDGKKETSLGPQLIELNMAKQGWIYDKDASSAERLVFYWPHILKVGDTTTPTIDKIKIDSSIGRKVTETTEKVDGKTIITTSFNYDGLNFQLEAEVDAVQTHNAADAIKSAWGVDVNVGSNGDISLR